LKQQHWSHPTHTHAPTPSLRRWWFPRASGDRPMTKKAKPKQDEVPPRERG